MAKERPTRTGCATAVTGASAADARGSEPQPANAGRVKVPGG